MLHYANFNEHNARLRWGKKREDLFANQLVRYSKSQRTLLFKRAALPDDSKVDCKLFDEHHEDYKNMLGEARNALVIMIDYVVRLEANREVIAGKLVGFKGSNKRIP
ncbi:hypothetical protein PF003_g3983 [Phytophthora fragariae]|nr:hypothetical protein PF003_g3983 [Phytophthora fragariae]